MRIYLLLGHPDGQSFCSGIADAYEEAARAAGHEVRRHNLGEMRFDPVLRRGYNQIQTIEPDLGRAQEAIAWCEHWVLVYPIWWGSVPALLKGFFDRAMVPGFAFHYHDTDPMWDAMLKGRTGQVITTSDGPNIWTLVAYRNSDLGTVKNATLQFCGINPVTALRMGGMRTSTPEKRAKFLERVRRSVPVAN